MVVDNKDHPYTCDAATYVSFCDNYDVTDLEKRGNGFLFGMASDTFESIIEYELHLGN